MALRPALLIVEDEFFIRAAAAEIAQAAGFSVVEAGNADHAIRIFESRPDIRVVFTDIDMPGSMDGLELARVIRDRWPPIELVVTSGKATPQPQQLPKGGHFIPKPYNYSELAGLFEALCG